MPIYALGDVEPQISPTAYVHPDAVLIGAVTVGDEATIWPGAVLRADGLGIDIGARTSIQDGSVLHCTPQLKTVVGSDVVVGHLVHLEACTIEPFSLVGNGSIVLHRAVVRSWSLVGSGAVLPDDFEVPSGTMALGVPAKVRDRQPDRDMITSTVEIYRVRGARYRTELRRIA